MAAVTGVSIDLDRSSPVPLYHQIAASIDRAIDSGELPVGAFLENEIALAARLKVSRQTARQAIQELVDKGRLLRKRGVGTQVASDRIRRPVALTSLYDDLGRRGREPSTVLLAYEVKPATVEDAEALEIPLGERLVLIRRLRSAGGEPLAVMTNLIPWSIAPSPEELEHNGLYDLLRRRGVEPQVARQRIGARLATAEEATMLDEPEHSALLTMERTAYDDAGTVIEVGRHIYRASRYIFDTTLFAG